MLVLDIPGQEFWDEKKEQFVSMNPTTLKLEHSLISLSRWEAKWHKPFLNEKTEKSVEETLDYIRCMTLNPNVDPEVYTRITTDMVNTITEYIHDPMTATWFSKEDDNPPSREIVTSEVVYYWMVALNIPFECQKWHLNRLLTLIRVCNAKNQPPKKHSKKEIAQRTASINAARRKAAKAKKGNV